MLCACSYRAYIYCRYTASYPVYRVAGKFGEFGESSMICQTKIIQISLTINNFMVDLLIRQTFFSQMLEKSQFAKLFSLPNFPAIQYVFVFPGISYIFFRLSVINSTL